jgi:molecular chaperone HscB
MQAALRKMQAQCPSCARLQEPRLFCSACGAPLAVELDYFAALGLPRKLTLDPSQLETLYHDLGRRVHPDRFASKAAPVRNASLIATALLTRAFRTLRDPVSRGLYWLELNGEKLARDNKKVPAELAELIFEIQESLAELQAGETNANNSEDVTRQVLAAKSDVQNLLKNAFAQLDQNYADWDNRVNHRADLIVQLKSILSRIAYLRTLDRDIDRVMEQHDLK